MTYSRHLYNGHAVSVRQATDAVSTLLYYLGYDVTTETLVDTPNRVVRALLEMTSGQAVDPATVLSRTFPAHPDSDHDELVALSGITFTSLCEHHLMPFDGTATVAYIPVPGGPVVGLSKLARLVDIYARRLTMQERLTRQVTAALDAHLATVGSACIIRSRHGCMTGRGVRQAHGVMTTSSLTGVFREDSRARAELLLLAGGARGATTDG
jgi:GTP cyclohydrolase I